MPKKDIHPQMYEVEVSTVNGVRLNTFTTKDYKGSTLRSDLDTDNPPHKREGLGVAGTRNASVQRHKGRGGSALGFAYVLSSK